MSTECRGSIYLKSHCGQCTRCIQSAKTIVNRFKASPMMHLPVDDREALRTSIHLLTEEFGSDTFSDYLKEGYYESQS